MTDAPLREALDLIEALLSTGGPAPGTRKEARQFVQQHRAALTARQSEATTPAPEPFYDSDGIPIPDELFAAMEPAPAPLDVDVKRLAQAIDEFITSQTGFDVDDAEAIAAIYARLTARAAEDTD